MCSFEPRDIRSLTKFIIIKPKSPSRLASESGSTNHIPATSAPPQPAKATKPEGLLTKEQLRDRLNLKSTRGVDELVRRRVVPVVVLGHRTRRFSWPAVQAAIEKLTIQAV